MLRTTVCKRYRVLTILWLMTDVKAVWFPWRECRLRARDSNSAWLHIWSSRGPKLSSDRDKTLKCWTAH